MTSGLPGVLLTCLGCVLLLGFLCHAQDPCPRPCTCLREEPGDRLIIDCKRKGLTVVPNITEDSLIHRLYLDGNRIQDILSNQFRGLHIKGVQFNDNPLMDIAEDAFAGLEPTLEYLSLQRTQLMVVPSAALAKLENLVVLDLSGVSPLMMLFAHEFAGLHRLEELILRSVSLIEVDADAFAGLSALSVLRMDSCALHDVPEAIEHLPALKYLHLDQNMIDIVREDAFQKTPSLRSISLSANRLADGEMYLPSQVFSGLKNLQHLDLGFNDFTEVPRHALGSLQQLKTLRLNDNIIVKLHPDAFLGLDSLTELDLSGNYGVRISKVVLADVRDTLEILRIGRVNMTWESFPSKVLRELSALRELDLAGNRFPNLPADAFKGIKAKTISLMYCDIQYTDTNVFRGLEAPVQVKLNWNNLTNITFVHDPCAFEKIELFHNPVNCDCHFRQMAQYHHIRLIGSCTTPKELGGQDLNGYVSGIGSFCNETEPEPIAVHMCNWDPEPMHPEPIDKEEPLQKPGKAAPVSEVVYGSGSSAGVTWPWRAVLTCLLAQALLSHIGRPIVN